MDERALKPKAKKEVFHAFSQHNHHEKNNDFFSFIARRDENSIHFDFAALMFLFGGL